MQIIWLGHSGFRIEIGEAVLLLDPWLSGNPSFPSARRAEAIQGATHILLTHGHGDHSTDAVAIARELQIPIACMHEVSQLLGGPEGAKVIGFGKGGTLDLKGVQVTMVNATHSSSLEIDGKITYAGTPAGFMIAGEGHVIYVSGDTDVMADMAIFNDLHEPDIGILACGGHYTMDMARAAYAVRKFFDKMRTVIPCHYKTFPILAQNADGLRSGVPAGVKVVEPEVLAAIKI